MTGAVGPLVQGLVDSLGERAHVSFAAITPDGTVYRTGTGDPQFRILFRSDAALLSGVRSHGLPGSFDTGARAWPALRRAVA